MSDGALPVVVVGAGISGIACAREIAAAGLPVVVRDRGHRQGGRMAVRTIGGRAIDVGASYFTADDDAFLGVVQDWCSRGLARAWTDSFSTGTPAGLGEAKSGPVRYAARSGLRSLVEDLAGGLDVRARSEVEEVGAGPTVDGEPVAAVVLAMPDPQALDLLDDDLEAEIAAVEGREWKPSIAMFAGWEERHWPDLDGVFVADSPVLRWIADDGRRRGDGAPVLVAHSTPEFASPRLDDPSLALAPMLAATTGLLGISSRPRWSEVKRWSLANPAADRAEPYFLGAHMVGLCGDGWGKSRVQTAYLSGRSLGRELATRLSRTA